VLEHWLGTLAIALAALALGGIMTVLGRRRVTDA